MIKYEDAVDVKIVGITGPIIRHPDTNELLTPEQFLVYIARVSNPSNQTNTLTTQKLIKYLLEHKHFSPFEMINVVFEIFTTRDIGRQILRHKSSPFSEYSQRYADPTKDLMFVLREARLQDTKNRQNSIVIDDEALQKEWYRRQMNQIELSIENYNWAIANNIAKEQARCVLPEGNTTTRMYMNAYLRSLLHYIDVRSDPSTQKEHRIIADKIKIALSEHFTFIGNTYKIA